MQKQYRKRLRETDVDEAIMKSLQLMDEQREARALQSQSMDEEDHFGQQIAAVLRRLPNRDKALAKLKIQQTQFEFEFPESANIPASPSLYRM